MALEHHFYLDTPASRHELRDALVQASVGLEAAPDWKHTSAARSTATDVTILVYDLLGHTGRPDNGVVPTRLLTFRDRKSYLSKPETEGEFERQTLRGIVALLKAYPEADAFWQAYDADRPVLLRRGGRLVLSRAWTEADKFWDAERQPVGALADLPYTVEPLGPWEYVPVEA